MVVNGLLEQQDQPVDICWDRNMAHPLKVGISVTSGPGMVLKRQELASLIGCVCSDWATVEQSLGSFYGFLMGAYLESPPGFEPPLHPVAGQIFKEIQTIHSRLNLVSNLADWLIKDNQQIADVHAVFKILRQAGQRRNFVAHAVWGICEAEPDALILLQSFGHKLIYRKEDFEIILEQIRTAQSELGRVKNKFYQSRKKKTSTDPRANI